MDQNYVVIVAGGKGSRMKQDLPKQFMELEDRPIIMHTLEAFHSYSSELNLILILPEDQMEFWNLLVKKHHYMVPHKVFAGGKDRTESVRNGLKQVAGEGLVAIHDGVRPFVSSQIIHESFFQASRAGNAIAAVKSKDSLRRMKDSVSEAVPREDYYLVQTPQTFRISIVKRAYEVLNPSGVSDDATVVEKYGERINLIEGDYDNIKITTPEDVELAKLILKRRKKK